MKVPWVERRACRICGVIGHIQKNCPDEVAPSTTLITTGEEDEDDEEVTYYHSDIFMMCEQCEPVFFSSTGMVFDNAAGRSVFKSKDLLTDIKTLPTPYRIGGVDANSGGLVVAEEGRIGSLTVGISPGSAANIMSQTAVMKLGFRVKYFDDSDEYLVWHPDGREEQYLFSRLTLPNGELAAHYTMEFGTEVLVNTEEENERRYTVREVKRSEAAGELMVRLGVGNYR